MEFHSILVPLTGTEVDEEAIKLACRLLDKKSKGKIYALRIIAIERALPLDAEIGPEIRKSENILDHIESIVKGQGCGVETDLLQAREIAPAIVDEAVEQEVDLILMGVKYKKRFGEFSLSDVVSYVLKNAPCHVILYHQYTT